MIEPARQKILLLSANPLQTGRLRVNEEIREIKAGLCRAKQRDLFEIETAEAVRYRDLSLQILEISLNIVHFSGHGVGEDGLVVEDQLENGISRTYGDKQKLSKKGRTPFTPMVAPFFQNLSGASRAPKM